MFNLVHKKQCFVWNIFYLYRPWHNKFEFPKTTYRYTHTNNLTCDYYAVLGVRPNDSQEKLKKAYYEKAKKLHPDIATLKNENNDPSSEFAQITEAYEILSDPQQRKVYDQSHYIEEKKRQSINWDHNGPDMSFWSDRSNRFPDFEVTQWEWNPFIDDSDDEEDGVWEVNVKDIKKGRPPRRAKKFRIFDNKRYMAQQKQKLKKNQRKQKLNEHKSSRVQRDEKMGECWILGIS